MTLLPVSQHCYTHLMWERRVFCILKAILYPWFLHASLCSPQSLETILWAWYYSGNAMYVGFLMYNILVNTFKCQRALFVLCPDVLLFAWHLEEQEYSLLLWDSKGSHLIKKEPLYYINIAPLNQARYEDWYIETSLFSAKETLEYCIFQYTLQIFYGSAEGHIHPSTVHNFKWT